MKIESGCLAIVIKSWAGNEGKSCTVIKYLGKVHGFGGDNRWETDLQVYDNHGELSNHFREEQLLRIDGFQQCDTKETDNLIGV